MESEEEDGFQNLNLLSPSNGTPKPKIGKFKTKRKSSSPVQPPDQEAVSAPQRLSPPSAKTNWPKKAPHYPRQPLDSDFDPVSERGASVQHEIPDIPVHSPK